MNTKKLQAFSASFLFFTIAMQTVSVQSYNSTPVWMKIDAFVEYKFASNGIYFTNQTQLRAQDLAEVTFRWDCIEINEERVKLHISLVFTEEENKTTLTTDVYVDTVNRSVFALNGTLIGTSFLWGPSNPIADQEIVLWDVPPDKIVGKVYNQTGLFSTIQGNQKIFVVDKIGNIRGQNQLLTIFYDFDTGIAFDIPFTIEGTAAPFGLESCGRMGEVLLSNTNIDLGPSEFDIMGFLEDFLPILAITVAALIILLTLYIRLVKKKK